MSGLRDREILRIMTFSAYDLQMIRMQMGLRLTANFRNKLKRELAEAEEDGIDVGEEDHEKEDLSPAALKLIDELKASHKRLTDAVAKSHRLLPKRNGFVGDGIISEFTELVLVDQYVRIEKDEKNQFAQLEAALEPMSIYQEFLEKQRGIGPAMAAVLVSYFDPAKAPRISNFWAYAGLDVVESRVFVTNCSGEESTQEIDRLSLDDIGMNFVVGEPMPNAKDGMSEGKSLDDLISAGIVGIYSTVGRGRSRRAEHLIDRPYITKDGKEATRKSVTYNPWLKSRLLGALAASFIKTTGCPWKEVYYNYKNRIMNDRNRIKLDSTLYKKAYRKIVTEGESMEIGGVVVDDITRLWPPLRIHRAALRYMIKMFLIDFWVAWRKCEGLEVSPTYHEAILGHKHHGVSAEERYGL